MGNEVKRIGEFGYASLLLTMILPAWCVPATAQSFGDSEIADRRYLSDNGDGPRETLEDYGITFDVDLTMFAQTIAGGGLRETSGFAGHGDYVARVDFGEMEFQEGLFLQARVENRYGTSINDETGAFSPIAVSADLPTLASRKPYLTNFYLAQRVGESLTLFAGKVDTLDGDTNRFASGRGKDQFSNYALVQNPILARTVPYSTLGGGFYFSRDERPFWTVSVLNATDTTRTLGFDELFAQGAVVVSELCIRTNFFGRPGNQLFGSSWSSRDFSTIGEDPRIMLPTINTNRVDGSWSSYWNFDQFLHVDPENPEQGWGLFGRVGAGDDRANPVHWFGSLGVAGNSWLDARPDDTFGLGWYYLSSSSQIDTLLSPRLGTIGDETGWELYYNVAMYRWFNCTFDFQFIDPAQAAVPASQSCGLRVQIDL
jgi:porin